MGQHGLSTEEKIARGTYRPAREEKRQGERIDAILAFPAVREIPKPSMPLREAGMKAFDEWALRLLNAGKLTAATLELIELLGMAKDVVHKAYTEGKMPTQRAMDTIRTCALKLETLNVDQKLQPAAGGENRFATNGFAARRRSPANQR